jgi:DNA-binding transcriptional MocR family regulator
VLEKAEMYVSIEDRKKYADLTSPILEQLTFAEFLREGELDRHLRRMRSIVSLRQKCLITAAMCAAQKISDNEGSNVIKNRQRLKSASESVVQNPGRKRQDSKDRSRRSRVTDREIRAKQTV